MIDKKELAARIVFAAGAMSLLTGIIGTLFFGMSLGTGVFLAFIAAYALYAIFIIVNFT